MILELGAHVAPVLASSGSSEGDASSLAYVLLLSGFVFYGLVYLRYRNTDKRHSHESETKATMHDVRAADEFHRSLKGVSNSRMKGANNTEVRGAHGGLSPSLELGDVGKLLKRGRFPG